jgi:hypothetical protein
MFWWKRKIGEYLSVGLENISLECVGGDGSGAYRVRWKDAIAICLGRGLQTHSIQVLEEKHVCSCTASQTVGESR